MLRKRASGVRNYKPGATPEGRFVLEGITSLVEEQKNYYCKFRDLTVDFVFKLV